MGLLELIGRLEALAAKATPGPWEWQDWSCYGEPSEGPNKQTLTGQRAEELEGIGTENKHIVSFEDAPENPADAELITELRNNVLALCTAARRSVVPDEVAAAAKRMEVRIGNACEPLDTFEFDVGVLTRWILSLTPEAASAV